MVHSSRAHIATIAFIITLLFAWTETHAMWAQLSDAELVDTSSLIVVGKLARMTVPSEDHAYTVGVIEIDDVLKGDSAAKTVWLDVPQPGTPISSSDIFYRVGQEGLWFLRLLAPDDGEIYAADHPQRFVPVAHAGPIIDEMRNLLKR